ncbi:MAG: DNA starvation/stationary phase protection protein [Propionibacteriales bacterium]|nr:DNA starvation/stationary phase protection protein [Propionibacteriales bacterium]
MGQVDVSIRIADSDRSSIADALSQLLADSYTLYLKTHNYHWNVTGPHFGALHAMFETQYTDLALAVDALAERIRALGHRAPGSYAEFSVRTEVAEATIEPTKAMEMVAALATDHQMVARAAARVISVANSGGDEPTAGLATTRQEVHEKAAWMLRSFLE